MDLDPFATCGHRAAAAQGAAAQALGRLVAIAERRQTDQLGQIVHVAQFLASTFDGHAFPFDLFELRAVDVATGDDMLACLDALRWGRADLHRLIPAGERRIRAVIDAWGLTWPEGNTSFGNARLGNA
ncbi:DUF7673 family protein [Variovorax saccharolyticus]|uniref:DUF7673 family protein n=1 Tax=Variovorax saccharolyticus TaxID=3053516 RepID=UPI002576FD67|nr:hypothetical protein [Variovorax sp. J31P216]MDM0029092.1 hypothetical protein [Variovorax sp. J31P216]